MFHIKMDFYFLKKKVLSYKGWIAKSTFPPSSGWLLFN